MKIYTIEHHGKFCYDSHLEHVIVADNHEQVIELAISNAGDEGAEIWKTATITEHGTYTGDKKEPFVLLSEYASG